ncbi:MAG: glycosyltransferase family 2 protein [Thermodesulfobacteriota bacterium]
MKKCDIVITVFKQKGADYYRTVESIAKNTRFPYNIITGMGDGSCAENRNIGLRQVKNDYIAIVDDDVIVTEGWLTQLIETMDKYNADIVFPKILDGTTGNVLSAEVDFRTFQPWSAIPRYYQQPDAGQADYIAPALAGGAGFMLIKREVFDKVGFYDERFKPNQYEDVDYFWRMWLAGFKGVYNGNISLFHLKLGRGAGTHDGTATRVNWDRLYRKWKDNMEDKSLIYCKGKDE